MQGFTTCAKKGPWQHGLHAMPHLRCARAVARRGMVTARRERGRGDTNGTRRHRGSPRTRTLLWVGGVVDCVWERREPRQRATTAWHWPSHAEAEPRAEQRMPLAPRSGCPSSGLAGLSGHDSRSTLSMLQGDGTSLYPYQVCSRVMILNCCC